MERCAEILHEQLTKTPGTIVAPALRYVRDEVDPDIRQRLNGHLSFEKASRIAGLFQ